MFNQDSLRKQLSHLSDEALLEACTGDLTELAIPVYEAELASRGLNWPSTPSDTPTEEEPSAPSDLPTGELVQVARFESLAEARLAITLLRNENIPVWLAGSHKSGQLGLDPNIPLDLVTQPEFLETAQFLLSPEFDEEELARLAEEAGEDPEHQENS